MKQKQYVPQSIAEMALSWFLVDKGYLDDVELKKVVDFTDAFLSFVRDQHNDLIVKINTTPKLDDDTASAMKRVIEEFKATQTW